MDVLELIKKRRSIRAYKNISVEKDKLAKVLEAAHYAPSAGNLQSWKFIVVKDSKKKSDIVEAALNQTWMSTAPVHIVVCASLDKIKRYYGVRGERLYAVQECAAAVENMLLAAEEQGLAACWVGAFDEVLLKRVLDIPDIARPQAIVTLGYADEIVPEPAKFKLRDVVYFERYGKTVDEFLPIEKQVKAAAEKAEPFIERMKGKVVDIIRKKK
ncbi:nitroreductase family protein [Candidatus Woesearchaeota archaeon]|nr:nitroreductase family protein [Candidatus Woesearchaeota archaeon]